ncbi:hypothetical protein DOTSEDRAFT_26900 [Dothistroma septosporum NZE10]|uniref:F-box domain-containing protein n=1 Tax=Dothistroma septosporum (strain NZE10 / CBS 128990) TaxID=675120 RepID=N1PGN8_DOTSN|nr:hypothetical protein DOTSEDRAFT_26900 [Dothistroma septosporum NZE10]
MASFNLTIRPAWLQDAQKVLNDLLYDASTAKEEDHQVKKHLDQMAEYNHTATTDTTIESIWPSRDDAMPLDAQRYMAAFLSSASSPFVPADTVATVLKNSGYINEKRKILGRTLLFHQITTPGTMTNTQIPRSRPQPFQDLPAELLALIRDSLPPADVIALTFTSRSYYTTLDFQLVDLRSLVLASDLHAAFPYQKFSHAINRERYDVSRRLRRDKTAHLLKLEDHTNDSILCSACTALHPARYFSPAQLASTPLQRTCLATEAKLRFCTHWSETLQTLRQRNEDARCKSSAAPANGEETCQDPEHYTPEGTVYDPPPSLRQLGGVQYVSKTIRMGHTDDYNLLTAESVKEALEKDPVAHVRVCGHVKAGDEEVVGSFERKEGLVEGNEWSVDMPQFEVGCCEVCGMRWQFRVKDMLGRCVARYELQLSVEWELRAVREAWTKEWLGLVEGGDELTELI